MNFASSLIKFNLELNIEIKFVFIHRQVSHKLLMLLQFFKDRVDFGEGVVYFLPHFGPCNWSKVKSKYRR